MPVYTISQRRKKIRERTNRRANDRKGNSNWDEIISDYLNDLNDREHEQEPDNSQDDSKLISCDRRFQVFSMRRISLSMPDLCMPD